MFSSWVRWMLACAMAGLWLVAPGTMGGAEVPDALLPPMARPIARLNTELGGRDRHSHSGLPGNAAALSGDGKLLVGSGSNQTALVDATSGVTLRHLGYMQMLAAAFLPDGKRVVTTEGDHSQTGVRLWDTATGKELAHLDEGVSMTHFLAVAWSPDGKTLALSGFNQRRGGGGSIVLKQWGHSWRPVSP